MRRRLLVLLVLLGGAAGASALRAPAPELTLTYYFIPGCSRCARTEARIADVVRPYCGRVQVRLVENRSAEGRAAAKRHGFASHGLVLNGPGDAPLLVEADHRVFPEHVAEALGRAFPAAAAPR